MVQTQLPIIRKLAPQVPLALRIYVRAHWLFFALYAALGKGFAYIGAPPIYVGEMLLCGGIVAAFATNRLRIVLGTPLGVAVACFVAWHMSCSIPYLGAYGIDTLRDSAAWGYAVFAVVVATLVVRYRFSLQKVVESYGTFAKWYVCAGPAAAALSTYYTAHLPVLPGAQVTVPLLKNGDLCVHLAGIGAFVLSGLTRGGQWLFGVAVAGAVSGGVVNRGGLLAFVMAISLALVLCGKVRQIYATAVALVLVGGFLVLLDPHVYVPGTTRELSARQIIKNLESVGSRSAGDGLDDTTQFRLEWWSRIFGYTVRGPYFWRGKGYGINLAYSDGIDLDPNTPLRSPHNSHLTFLARGGVPGLFFWIALQTTWCVMILRAYLASRGLREHRWSALFAWLLSYWLAFCLNASFDVALEGPMGAIPFWSVFGIGWGSHLAFNRQRAPGPARHYRFMVSSAVPAAKEPVPC